MSHRDDRELTSAEIARLIEEAGPRGTVDPDRLEEIRAAARSSWRESLAGAPPAEGAPEREAEEEAVVRPIDVGRARPVPPRRGAGPWLLAAALLAGAVVAGWWLWRLAAPAPVGGAAVAVVEAVRGTARASDERGSRELAAGDAIASGERLQVATGGSLALRYRDGALRLAPGSAVRVVGAAELFLSAGAVYFDSNGREAEGSDAGEAGSEALGAVAPLVVRSELGSVVEIGTRFEVRLLDDGDQVALRVRVREGRVALSGGGVAEQAGAGVELVLRAGGDLERSAVSMSGPGWDWVVGSAPPFDPEGRSLGALLDWIERHTGWTVRFADPALESLRAEILHGPVVERPDRGFDDHLASLGLAGEVEDGVLRLRADDAP